jgi:hypothetical protein
MSTLKSVNPTFNSDIAWKISFNAKEEIQLQINKFEHILELIETAAKEGFSSIKVPEFHKNIWIELDDRGFCLSQDLDDNKVLITW